MSRTLQQRCKSRREHEAEAFLLTGALTMGTFDTAGLMCEHGPHGEIGFWKVMRCGCTFIALAVFSADEGERLQRVSK